VGNRYLKLLHYFNRDVKPRKRTTEDELVGEMDRPIGAFGSSDTSVDSHVRLQSDESVERSVDTQAKTDELERGPRAAIIGFTATFSRHDQQALDTVFDEIVYHQDVWDMLQAGWLAPARFTTVKAHMDLADVAVNEGTGDFVKKKLSGKVNQPEVNELVVRTWLDRAGTSGRVLGSRP
jgi:superfamily II DNA or RNA helicase